jgi:hypothetical protein
MMGDKMFRKFIVFSLSFLAITVAYQNCGSSGGGGGGGAVASNSTNGDIVAIPNTKTASIQRSSRVLDQLVSCLGTGEPSNRARDVWRSNRGTISEEGLANSMTQPMAKTLVTVSAEVCGDLLNQERGVASGERRIFVEPDLDQGGLSSNHLILASKRIARSCWGRNATEEELQRIVTTVNTAFSGEDDNGDLTRNKLIFMCTAMASSFDAFNM